MARRNGKIEIDGEKWDYLTYEFRAPYGICVHAWGTYPRNSVLAGQPLKRFLDSFGTVEEAVAAYPSASPSHPMLQPQVSLNHLPDENDPVPGGMFPDDYEDRDHDDDRY